MKGVSAVIAVILILMIVVAMAALAYTWFTSMATDLMSSTGESIEQSTSSMAKGFAIASAGCNGAQVQFSIVNTGLGTLDRTKVEGFVDGLDIVVTDVAGTIAEGATVSFTGTTGGCTSGDTLRVVIESGLAMTTTIA